MHRRNFIAASASLAAVSTLKQHARAEATLKGKAEHVISIWLGGGMGSLDIMELNPAFDDHNRTAVLSVDLVESLFGKSTLMRD